MKNSSNDRGSKNAPPKKIVVLGVGNELLTDEGIGVAVARKMMNMSLPDGVEIIEGGTDGFGLLNIITDTDHLIVIDSVKSGQKAGTIYRFNVENVSNTPDMFKTSVHQIGILEVIHLSELIGKTPQTVVIGIEPGKITTGMELSPEVNAKIPKVIELVKQEISRRLNR